MGYLRELAINTGWIKPRPGEFLPEHQELGLAYQLFELTFRDSRRELGSRPGEEEIVRDLMGKRIKERALRVVRAGLKASFYSPDLPGPHEVSISSDYLFSFKHAELISKPASRQAVELDNLPPAQSEAWFDHGKTVVDATLAHLIDRRGLPKYLARIQIPR